MRKLVVGSVIRVGRQSDIFVFVILFLTFTLQSELVLVHVPRETYERHISTLRSNILILQAIKLRIDRETDYEKSCTQRAKYKVLNSRRMDFITKIKPTNM